ncbi:CopG family ribbon-helix-helix protein [Chlorobium sp. KB01]|uniref:CopG family ribbon-helix-helix protein n=1 Tax=Chlorobium sp. KB01 TaxID=1917528 RepID=UPI0009767D83|nr:CopG family transcriptional regulator [Chlorobium sp. KB01]
MVPAAKRKEVREQVSFKIAAHTKLRIEQLAQATRRSKTFVIEEAINHYLSINEWQIKSIQAGLDDLDAGNVIPQEEMTKLWGGKVAGTVD